MPNKRGKVKPDRTPERDVIYRAIEIRDRGGIDEENRSVPVVIATETPVKAFDFGRMDVVDEKLMMRGAELPSKLALLDSHNRDSVRSVLGSIRNLEIKGGELHGRAFFSSKPAGVEAFRDVADGHLDDISVGARRLSSRFEGNTKLVERWAPFEGSVVAAGSDPNSKVLREAPAYRAYLDPFALKEEQMFDELKALLVQRGMPTDIEDGKPLLDWASQNLVRKADDGAEDGPDREIVEMLRRLEDKIDTPDVPAPGDKPQATDTGSDDLTRAEIEKETRQRLLDIDELCRAHDVDEKQRKLWLDGDISVDQVARAILKTKATGGVPIGPGDRIEGGESRVEKFFAAARDGVMMRAIQGANVTPHKALEQAKSISDADAIRRSQTLVDQIEKPAAGYDDFRYLSLQELAQRCLEESGQRVSGLPKNEIVRRAFAMPNVITRADTPAYHTTGSFSNVMLDAANKTLLAAYDEAQVTYPIWVRQAPSAADFKDLHRIRFGEMPDPEMVPENDSYKDMTTSDSKETYGVETYGQLFSISLRAVINDDLNAISRIPAMQGTAMRRKINKVAYAILTANDDLSDGVALFHSSSHGANLDATALAAAALDTGYQVMMTQAGLTSGTILNIMPRYLIVPAALSATALQIVRSNTPPDVGGDTTGTSGTANLYGPGGPRQLIVVTEGQLDSNSATAWYLAADHTQVDTVELTFLQGEEAPVLAREEGFAVDAIRYKIRQTFAAKAIDYRGLYQGNS